MAEENITMKFPSHITYVLTCCACRFDGDRYLRDSGLDMLSDRILNDLSRPIIDKLTMHDDVYKNFAAFYSLQRFLHRGFGSHLTKFSIEHIAYDFLYLHLFPLNVPPKYRAEEFCERWEEDCAKHAEKVAAFVRRSLLLRTAGMVKPNENTGILMSHLN